MIGQILLLAGAEALAQANQQQQRTHSPGDAEHGEKGAQLVRPQGAQHFREHVEGASHLAIGHPLSAFSRL